MSDSKPLMFIYSIQEIKEAKKETQKNVSLNRIDDIKAMLYYKMDILIEVKTKNTLIEGVVKSVDENGLTIEADNKLEVIKLDEIVHINILRIRILCCYYGHGLLRVPHTVYRSFEVGQHCALLYQHSS